MPPPVMDFSTPEPHHHGGGRNCGTDMKSQTPAPKTLNDLEAQFQQLQRENFDLKMTIFYQDQRFSAFQGGDVDANERMKDLEDELREAQHFVEEKQQDVEELSATLERTKEVINKLKDDLQFKNHEAAELANINLALRQRMTDLEDQVRSNRGDGLEASEKLGATQAMVETQELTIRRLEEEKAMAIDEAKEAHWRVQEGRREYEELKVQHDVQLARMNAEIKALEQSLRSTEQEKDKEKLQLARDSRVVSTRVEELQSKVRAAEEKAVDAEAKLDEYKEELEQLAHAVQEKEGEILDVHDRLQDAENRVEAERAEVEKLLEALRKSEDQIEALNRDMDGVGRSERERADAVKARADDERRAKEALLEELGGARHQHRVLLQEVWNMLLNFNAALDFYLADLLASAAVEERGTLKLRDLPAVEEISSANIKSKLKLVLESWNGCIKELPNIKKKYQDTTATETAKHSYRVQELEKELRDREREYEKDLASKEARLMHMEAELRRASEARDTRELSLEAKVVELTDKLSAERERGCKERDSHVEAQRRLMEDERRRLLDSEARLREDLEKCTQQVKITVRDYEEAKQARMAAEDKARDLHTQNEAMDTQMHKLQRRVRDYEELKVTASRLMRHIQARDDKIARMTQVITQHGYRMDADVTSFADIDLNMSQATSSFHLQGQQDGEGRRCAIEELVQQQLMISKQTIDQSREGVDVERLHFSRSGGDEGYTRSGSYSAVSGGGQARADLDARVEMLGQFVHDLKKLAQDTKQTEERFEGLRTGAGYSSAKPIWVDQMDSKMAQLLKENGHLQSVFQKLCSDLQKIYKRLKSDRWPSGKRENDRNAANTSHAPPSSQYPLPDKPSPYPSGNGAGKPSTYTSSFDGRLREAPHAPRDSRGSYFGTSTQHPVSGSSGHSGDKGHTAVHSTALEPAASSQLQPHRPIHSLERISHDLQQIAHKLEIYKATATRPSSALEHMSSKRW